jgi:hypothetical protein
LSGGLAASAASAGDGSYSFPSLAVGLGYAVSLARPDDTPLCNGVSTLDIALIRRHILGTAPLSSPYQLLAADVEGSGTISTVDIALIRRLILGITNTFPAGLWRFVPADYVFPDAAHPWSAPAQRWYSGLMANEDGQDYVAIKLGDVNGSWVCPGAGPQAIAQAGASAASKPDAKAKVELPPVRCSASGQVAEPGRRAGVRVSLGGLAGLSSAQFTLGWDAAVLRYAGVGDFGLPGLEEGNFGTAFTDSGKLAFSWDDPAGLGTDAAEGATAFTVYFDVVGPAGNISPVAFGDWPTKREASVGFVERALATQDGQVTVAGERPVIGWKGEQKNGTLRITVPSAKGRRYLLECSEALSGDWRALGETEGDGSVMSLIDPGTPTQQRFYRVRIR